METPSSAHRGFSGILTFFCAAILFVMYLFVCNSLLLPGVGYHPDTIKYQFIGKVLGLSNPTGSPLYILINWIVAQLPFGELAWRINLMSAIFGGASLMVFFTLLRKLRIHHFSAFAGAMVFSLLPLFVSQSVVAEVYTLHLFMILLSMIFFIEWDASDSTVHFALGSIVYGLSFAVHSMSILAAPGLAIFLLLRKKQTIFSLQRIIILIVGAVSAIIPFSYYLIRSYQEPYYAESFTRTLGELFSFIIGGNFRDRMFAYNWEQMHSLRAPWALEHALINFGWILLLAGFIGLVFLAARNWRIGSLFGLMLICSTWYAMGYNVGDAEIFLFPAFIALALGIAVFCETIIRFIKAATEKQSLATIVGVILMVAFIGLALFNLWPHLPALDRSKDTDWDLVSQNLVADLADDSLIISADQWWFLSIAYQLWGEDKRVNDGIELTSISRHHCESLRSIIAENRNKRPIYFTADLADCLVEIDAEVERIDLSKRLDQYLKSLPDTSFIFLAIFDEGTAALNKDILAALTQIGISIDLRSGYRWSLVAAYLKENGVFNGTYRFQPRGVTLRFMAAETLAGQPLPVNVTLESGGALSGRKLVMQVGENDYARELRGLHIIVFDAKTGRPIDRKTIDTHKYVTLMDRYFFKLK